MIIKTIMVPKGFKIGLHGDESLWVVRSGGGSAQALHMVSPRQLHAARILAGLSQADLATASDVSIGTVQGLETGNKDTRLSSLMAVLKALRDRGVELSNGSERYVGGVKVVRGSVSDWIINPDARNAVDST